MVMKAGLLLAMLPLSQPLDDSYLVTTLEWVRSHGGFFNEKLDFGTKDGIVGILAKESIQKGETLISTPWELIIHPRDNDESEDDPCYSPLAAELRKGEDSFFAPYLRRYLSDQYSAKLLPATWSDTGKDLLGLVFGNGNLPPRRAFTHLFRRWKSCKKRNDPIQRLAISLHETHCEEHVHTGACELFVPLEDTITNHCRGNLPCLDLRMDDKKSFVVVASRDVETGEMLCHDYYEGDTKYGTPELLRDYGFVEDLPQRWIFRKYKVGFDIEESGGVVWHENAEVTKESIHLLREHLQYLWNVVRPKFETAPETIPPKEMDTIWRYYEALVSALEKAIAASGLQEEEIGDKRFEDEF